MKQLWYSTLVLAIGQGLATDLAYTHTAKMLFSLAVVSGVCLAVNVVMNLFVEG